MIFSITNFISSALRIIAIEKYNLYLLIIARLIAAASCSVIYQTQLLFLQECAPSSSRGLTSFLSGIWFAFVAVITMFLGLDWILGKKVEWLVIGASVLTFLSLIIVLPFHETPKFLFIIKNDKKAAIDSILFYQGPDAKVEEFLSEIQQESQIQKEKNKNPILLFKKKATKKALILTMCALQNTVAFWSILMSSTYFLLQAGIDNDIAQASTTLMAGVYFLGTIGGMFWIAKVKRRTIVVWFTVGNTATLAFYCLFASVDTWVNGLKYGCLFCLLAYGFTYG